MNARIETLTCSGAPLGRCRCAGQAAVGTARANGGLAQLHDAEVPMTRKIIFGAALFLATAAAAAPPALFLTKAIQGNFSEVTLGRIIQNRGASAEVRQFGAMLVSDHSKGLAQAQQIASRLRLRIPATLTPKARSEQHRLRGLGGRAFDREVRRYMIDDHREDITEFREQARSGDRATSGYAAATVPVMQRHLAAARAIRG
jgi:putative membrane protein